MNSRNGVITVRSVHNYPETCQRLDLLIRTRGMTMFADLDFQEEARSHRLTMSPERLFVFGNPSSGTPLMQEVAQSGLDLPLKVLVHQDGSGSVWLSYNSPRYLIDRHTLPQRFLRNIAGIEELVERAAGPSTLLG